MNNDNSFDKTAKEGIINSKNWIVRMFLSNTREIISAVIIGVAVTVFSAIIMNYLFSGTEPDENLIYTEEPSQLETTEATNRIYFIQAHLTNVLSIISSLKTQVAIYYQTMGELPRNPDDIGLGSFDLEEYKQIESTYLTNEGGIGVKLSEIFGEDKYLVISPQTSKNGAFIKWSCNTNVSKKYLGIPKNRICEFQEEITKK